MGVASAIHRSSNRDGQQAARVRMVLHSKGSALGRCDRCGWRDAAKTTLEPSDADPAEQATRARSAIESGFTAASAGARVAETRLGPVHSLIVGLATSG
jgi:hypothetical protein